MWGLTDAEVTYANGTSITASESDARSAGNALVTALSGVNVGSDHGASDLASALSTFQTDSSDSTGNFADAVSRLGENTSNGAQTGVQTDNEGTQVGSNNTALARDLNGRYGPQVSAV